jgi:hypothetical protein
MCYQRSVTKGTFVGSDAAPHRHSSPLHMQNLYDGRNKKRGHIANPTTSSPQALQKSTRRHI